MRAPWARWVLQSAGAAVATLWCQGCRWQQCAAVCSLLCDRLEARPAHASPHCHALPLPRRAGKHETCDINTFRYGVADRGSSIRIPLPVQLAGKVRFGLFCWLGGCLPRAMLPLTAILLGPCILEDGH